ncbi:hypothetical protein QJQ45_004663 [Haematococcus lacustris]|nr:hypothetical protein QJQ45_004663 [Haematococcus lacustris]
MLEQYSTVLLPGDVLSNATQQQRNVDRRTSRAITFQTVLLALLASVCALLLWQRTSSTNVGDFAICQRYLGTAQRLQPFSVIMTADPGTFSGVSEARYVIENLQDKHMKPVNSTVCGGVFYGSLMGQRVLVVTTGIGPPAASLCTLEVVSACGASITEILFFGTSGWSPQLGGVLNPPDCAAANDNQQIARLGDVCVSPFSVNWTCKKSSWAMEAVGYPNQCFRPEEVTSPSDDALHGNCQFYADNLEANLALASQVAQAAASPKGQLHMPMRSPAVVAVDHSGVPWEVKARDYAAQTLAAALGGTWSAADVLAVSAMEGIGVAEALLKYHQLAHTRRKIPYTHVRTLSNWLHPPVQQVRPGVWEVAVELPEDFVTGYGYAIATGSSVLMSLYQQRCVERSTLVPGAHNCSYTISYDSAA